MRRTFWIAVGVTGTVLVLRWLRKQRRRMSPEAVAVRMGEAAGALRHRVRASMEEGRRAMRAKEAELRTSLDER